MKTNYQYEYYDLITIQINETETFENIVSVPLKENSEFVQLGEYFAINKNAISTIDNILDKGYKVVICTNVNRKYSIESKSRELIEKIMKYLINQL